jgi:hypothetical protein
MDAGFTSKSGQKAAAADVTRAYEMVRREVMDELLALPRDAGEWQNPAAADLYWDFPSYPHQWRAKHAAQLLDVLPGREATVAQIAGLVDLRAAILATPVVPVERKLDGQREAAVQVSIRDLMARRREQYNRALDLAELFGGLQVSANVHLVTNEHGTTFLRAFFYLRGQFTPLNVILAAADELARRAA